MKNPTIHFGQTPSLHEGYTGGCPTKPRHLPRGVTAYRFAVGSSRSTTVVSSAAAIASIIANVGFDREFSIKLIAL